jgi:SAM-dependent methyltransferase
MKEKEIWERTWKKVGYDELNPDENVVSLVPFLKKNKVKKILDLGCGVGRHMIYLGKQGFFMVGSDISPTALKLTKEWLEREKLKNYFLVENDVTKLPFPKECFDTVLSINVIHHNPLNKIEKTTSEIERILKKGGIAVITVNSINDRKFGTGRKIEHNTYATLGSEHIPIIEGRVVHHFFDGKDVKKLFSKFKIIKIKEEIKDLGVKGKIKKSAHWLILCQK